MCSRHDHPPYDQAPMTTDDLARLRSEYDALASTATAGPWHHSDRGIGWEVHTTGDPNESCWNQGPDGEWPNHTSITDYGSKDTLREADAALIVWLRNNADALLDAAEASERLREAVVVAALAIRESRLTFRSDPIPGHCLDCDLDVAVDRLFQRTPCTAPLCRHAGTRHWHNREYAATPPPATWDDPKFHPVQEAGPTFTPPPATVDERDFLDEEWGDGGTERRRAAALEARTEEAEG